MTKLIQLTNVQMSLVENKWHHAVLSYFQHIPTIEKRYPDEYYTKLTYMHIEDIIEEFGIEPPKEHWYNKEKEIIFDIIKNLFCGYIIYNIYKYLFTN